MANDYVSFKEEIELEDTAAAPLTGGTNGTVDGTAHQTYLDLIESYSYNTMGVAVTDETTKSYTLHLTNGCAMNLELNFRWYSTIFPQITWVLSM